MDESVRKALARWPDVPNVYGWLDLDRRGDWMIKGERIGNAGLKAFIARNYECDSSGRWFFQNGPQRVFVTLAYLPFVLRTSGTEPLQLNTHSGRVVDHVTGAWIDDRGGLVLRWSEGVGAVDDRDLADAARCFTDSQGRPMADAEFAKALDPATGGRRAGFWFDYGGKRLPVGRISAGEVAQKFGFDPEPRPAQGEPDC
jgi:hypothetical protein